MFEIIENYTLCQYYIKLLYEYNNYCTPGSIAVLSIFLGHFLYGTRTKIKTLVLTPECLT